MESMRVAGIWPRLLIEYVSPWRRAATADNFSYPSSLCTLHESFSGRLPNNKEALQRAMILCYLIVHAPPPFK